MLFAWKKTMVSSGLDNIESERRSLASLANSCAIRETRRRRGDKKTRDGHITACLQCLQPRGPAVLGEPGPVIKLINHALPLADLFIYALGTMERYRFWPIPVLDHLSFFWNFLF
jgi:hypothetical protein